MNLHATSKGGPTCLTTNLLKSGLRGLCTCRTVSSRKHSFFSFSNLKVAMADPPQLRKMGRPFSTLPQESGFTQRQSFCGDVIWVPRPHEPLHLRNEQTLVPARVLLGPRSSGPHPHRGQIKFVIGHRRHGSEVQKHMLVLTPHLFQNRKACISFLLAILISC